jgi:hypothetical protein
MSDDGPDTDGRCGSVLLKIIAPEELVTVFTVATDGGQDNIAVGATILGGSSKWLLLPGEDAERL